MLVSAVAEVVSLGAVLPFLSVLTAPEKVLAQPLGARFAAAWGVTSAAELTRPFTLLFVAAIIGAGAVRMLLLWSTTRFTLTSGVALSAQTYRRTLYQPYLVHVARSSSGIISGLTYKVNSVVFGVVMQSLVLISSIALLVAVVAALVAVDPVIAMGAAVALGLSYSLITWVTRHRLRRNSELISEGQTQLVKTLQDGLGGIRDVLLDGTQPVYCDIYQQADLPLRQAQCNNTFIAQSPRYVMEAFGMVLIAGLAYGLSTKNDGIASSLPMLGALALGAQRLLPALQQAYSAWQSVAGNQASLADVIELLDQPLPATLLEPPPPPLPLHQAIRLDSAAFRYTDDGPWVLDGIDLTIAKGARIGFVGSTGSGKSTLMDLLMGLLPPTKGAVLVDGEPVSERRARAWQQSIAHVPQAIYLADASFAENIAFGVPVPQIDMHRVREAARRAQIAEHIEARVGGYDARVGERGVRLSGGQRQRIGIARALYKQASVLVFDEATSALDNATEQAVMQTIESLDRDLTILLIAHRLGTVRHCDSIVELSHGRVVAQGTFEQLLQDSASFRKMAREPE
ncbi:ABC transporter ATP-binding protein [Lysobacter lacus]|uniref:ABC transporter ATP-binding protein n=2 Tax=Cognatilysobacter lacus TaxID=1643323 RepID=A0A5D8YXV0_9GAMM|nr:ABC transporter ATP-binding protein [Lysobacter lacus]